MKKSQRRAGDRSQARGEGCPTRAYRLRDVTQELGEPDEVLLARALERVGLGRERLRGFRIARRALDARRQRGILRFVCHVDLVVDVGERAPRLRRLVKSGRVTEAPLVGELAPPVRHESLEGARVVVVGSGPAGALAAYSLGLAGARVELLERGSRLDERGPRVVGLHRRRVVDGETNLLFGEGGAGTYSDGKLYTRVDDPLEVPILELLVECGAPDEIVFDSRAHVGTDQLHRLLPRLRRRLESVGVTLHFDTRLDDIVLEEGPPRRVRAVRTSQGELPCDALVLATGHSARDTWDVLAARGVAFEAKPFQYGVRIEHPQELVTRGRYGEGPEAQVLGAAAYNLTCRAGDGLPGAHSFCMCPGGRIVASVHEPGHLCTNGMSNSTHSSRWANAALVVTARPDEYGALLGAEVSGPFAGVALQRALEARFFEAGGRDYHAPAQRADDFLAGRESAGELASSYVLGTVPGRIDLLLPRVARDALRRALERFDRPIPGFAGPEGLLVGVETRSSGPVRMPRDRETFRGAGFANLYPIGEGAGWAGGIMSAALDGARCAHALALAGV